MNNIYFINAILLKKVLNILEIRILKNDSGDFFKLQNKITALQFLNRTAQD